MARTKKQVDAEFERICAEIAKHKGEIAVEHKAIEEEKPIIKEENKEVIKKAALVVLNSQPPINKHVRGALCKIPARKVICRNCKTNFISDEAHLYESNVAGRVVCVCPACAEENLIKKISTYATIE